VGARREQGTRVSFIEGISAEDMDDGLMVVYSVRENLAQIGNRVRNSRHCDARDSSGDETEVRPRSVTSDQRNSVA
jgi:hypothetical protein